MFLVVDAEVIFASLIKRGFTLELIKWVKEEDHELVTPEYIFEEVRRKEAKLLKYSTLEQSKLWYSLFLLFEHIKPVPKEEYSEFLEEAKETSPLEDFPYTALALKYLSLSKEVKIWSNDPELKESLKDKVEVLTTKELLKELGADFSLE